MALDICKSRVVKRSTRLSLNLFEAVVFGAGVLVEEVILNASKMEKTYYSNLDLAACRTLTQLSWTWRFSWLQRISVWKKCHYSPSLIKIGRHLFLNQCLPLNFKLGLKRVVCTHLRSILMTTLNPKIGGLIGRPLLVAGGFCLLSFTNIKSLCWKWQP